MRPDHALTGGTLLRGNQRLSDYTSWEGYLRVSDLGLGEVGVYEEGERASPLRVGSQTSQVIPIMRPVHAHDCLRQIADGGQHARDSCVRLLDAE